MHLLGYFFVCPPRELLECEPVGFNVTAVALFDWPDFLFVEVATMLFFMSDLAVDLNIDLPMPKFRDMVMNEV